MQAVHACRLCVHTGFAHLQGVRAHRAYVRAGRACSGVCSAVHTSRVCGWEDALGQDQAMVMPLRITPGWGQPAEATSQCLARPGAHPAPLGVFLQGSRYEELDEAHQAGDGAGAAHCFPI